MIYTATGRLKDKKHESGVSQKTGKPWQKLTFVIDITEKPEYPEVLAFDVFKGQLMETITDTSIDTLLKVEFVVKSREYNGRYFHNVNALNAEVVRQEDMVINAGDHNGVNQANQMYGSNGQVNVPEPSFDEDDSLPF